MDKIRCPTCRGAKTVAKIGGMLGDCNACLGTGSINADDKPKPIVSEPVQNVTSIINQVAGIEHQASIDTLPTIEDVKVDPKRTLYKRKK